MCAAPTPANSDLFGNTEHLSVSRALSELQARRPIRVNAPGEVLLALPVEGLDDQRLHEFVLIVRCLHSRCALSCLVRTVVDMSGRAVRLDDRSFRSLIVAAGLCWSAVFPVIALFNQLELYGDGAMFSYAVAVQDVWAFHWHNISGRTSVFLLTLLPAEVLVGITRNPWAGIIAYGLLFYISPLAGLIATYAADRSPGRLIFVYACGSTALLCPLIFGFPTEMWLAHAIFWPALALGHYAKPGIAGTLLMLIAWLLLAFTHEGALVLLLAIVATLAPRVLWSATFVRAAISLTIIEILNT